MYNFCKNPSGQIIHVLSSCRTSVHVNFEKFCTGSSNVGFRILKLHFRFEMPHDFDFS